MRNQMRNLTLSAAALAAILVTAPTVSADQRGGSQRERGARTEASRREVNRGREINRRRDFDRNRGFQRNEGFRAHLAPRYFAPRFVAPFRVVSGIRFYNYCPGPGYLYVDDGWVLPPFVGAVWAPAHYDQFGIWCGGHWR